METRLLTDISSTLTDYSVESNDYYAQTVPIVLTTSDYLYIGQRHPFNHLYFKFDTVNTNTLTISISLWDGDEWIAVADIQDETNGLKQDGFITWTPDKHEGWAQEDTVDSNDNEEVDGLGDVRIYDRYWARFAVSTNVSASSALQWVGNLFSNDNDLKTEYAELVTSSYLDAWESGKTDWEEQHYRAAEIVINDLIKKNIIKFKGQVLERDTFKIPSVHSVAEMIYAGLGDDYENNRTRALNKYIKSIDKVIYNVDLNRDGLLNDWEANFKAGKFTR